MNKNHILIITVAILTSRAALSANKSLICENFRREYLVEFDESKRKLVLDQSSVYKVLAVEKQNKSKIVVGTTVNNGPTFRLVLPQDKKPRFEFYADGKLFQTDRCKYIK